MVRTVATDRRRVQLVIAPAGAGKTTALKVLADTVDRRRRPHPRPRPLRRRRGPARRGHRHHRRHPGPAHLGARPPPTAAGLGRPDRPEDAAADRRSRDGRHPHPRHRRRPHPRPGWAGVPGRRRPAARRDRRRRHPHRPRRRYGAVRLTQLHRFADPDEAAATLQVRNGDPDAVDFYTDRDRIKIGDPSSLPDRVLAAWQHDQRPRPRLADAGPVPPPGRRPQPARPSRPARRPTADRWRSTWRTETGPAPVT